MVLQFRALFKGWMETTTPCLLPYHSAPRIQYFLGAYLCRQGVKLCGDLHSCSIMLESIKFGVMNNTPMDSDRTAYGP